MLKPPTLKEGDTVATVTLSWGGPGTFPHRYEAGKHELREKFGVNVIEAPNALRPADWIYNNPKARADDLMWAFSDPSIKGIISTIGGDESVRILPYVEPGVITGNPKVFLGYSDTTVAHFLCFKAGVTSFYGPSVMAGFAENGGIFPYMEESVRRTLFKGKPQGVIEPNHAGWTVEHLNWEDQENQKIRRKLRPPTGPRVLQGTGKGRGRLIGGCLEVMEMLKATDYWPDRESWKGAILFLETSEEAPDTMSFTRWIRNYGSQGILENLSGIILARPGGPLADDRLFQYDNALKEIITGELGLEDMPVLCQMDFGHTDPMFVIPYGVEAEINCADGSFSILESGVTAP